MVYCPDCKQKFKYFMDKVSRKTQETWYMCEKCGPIKVYGREETKKRKEESAQLADVLMKQLMERKMGKK